MKFFLDCVEIRALRSRKRFCAKRDVLNLPEGKRMGSGYTYLEPIHLQPLRLVRQPC
jgi:hypothetical protein